MPADAWSNQRLDELSERVRVVLALATDVGVHTAQLDGLGDDIRLLRESQREAIRDLRVMVEAIGRACEEHTRRVERKIDEQAKVAAANRWSPTQWAAVLGPTLTALIGAAALILTGGPK